MFNAYKAGEDVSGLFYASEQEYLDSIDFITNTWITPYDSSSAWNMAWKQDRAIVQEAAKSHDVYMLDCNSGPNVKPLYKVVLLEEDGSETLLQDYSENTLYLAKPGTHAGKTLRVYARTADAPQQSSLYDDLAVPACDSSLD